jgi:hypothetical protein
MVLVDPALVPVFLALFAVLRLRVGLALLSAVSVLTFALSRRRRWGTVPGSGQSSGDADAGDEQPCRHCGPRSHDLHSLHTLSFLSVDGQAKARVTAQVEERSDVLRSPLRCKAAVRRSVRQTTVVFLLCSLDELDDCLDRRRASHDGGVAVGWHAVS